MCSFKVAIIEEAKSSVVLSGSHKAPEIREAVCEAYSEASKDPRAKHPFPVGREFAQSLGYPSDLLAELPAVSVEAFSGVSNVSVHAEIPEGACVLDLGCGAGVDSLIAARRSGQRGKVVGMDFSASMLERAHRAASEAGLSTVIFCRGDAEHLPIKSDSVDVALVNGIFNLNPARAEIFAELGRVVRPGGVVYAAELILTAPLPAEVQASEQNWFA